MKKHIVLLMFLINIHFLSAQTLDLIVTSRGDSVACKIDSLRTDKIFFKAWKDGNIISSSVGTNSVADYKINFIDRKSIRWIPGSIYFETKNAPTEKTVSFSILGTSPFAGVSFEKFITDKTSFEAGIGILGLGLGFKKYPAGFVEDKYIFHWGVTVAYATTGDNEFIGFSTGYVYFPLGFSMYRKTGFTYGIDLGPSIIYFDHFWNKSLLPWGSLKIGKRF